MDRAKNLLVTRKSSHITIASILTGLIILLYSKSINKREVVLIRELTKDLILSYLSASIAILNNHKPESSSR